MFGKTYFSILAASAVAGLVMLSAANAQANIILNGDFSSNALSYTNFPGYSVAPNPSAPTDWLLSTPSNQGVNGSDTGFYASPPPNSGSPFAPANTNGVQDFAFLQGTGNISQTVATTAGQAYTLTYDGAARDGETADVLEVILTDATDSTPIVTQFPTISYQAFNLFTLNFTAPSASTEVQFLNGAPTSGPNAGETVDVSNVTMSAVPEPNTLWLVALGGLGLLLIGRTRAADHSA